MNHLNKRTLSFVLITMVAILVAVVYVALSAQRPRNEHTAVATFTPRLEIAQATSMTATIAISISVDSPLQEPDSGEFMHEAKLPAGEPFFVSLNLQSDAEIGKVRVSTVRSPETIVKIADLRCERVYFAANHGICLSRVIENVSAYSVATLFDADFQPQTQFQTDGIPSRARVSGDGRYAAFTVFVLGHSYADDNFSTATYLLDTTSGQPLANLEEFSVFQDGVQISYPDFNFWGVTFTSDSNIFYATLRFNRTPYLVKGDIKARTFTVLHAGVECPSLSPDESRIVFKKMVALADWRLTVMDLATYRETPLSESRSVDDQAEWLDDDRILFALPDPELPAGRSIMVVNADGSGEPQRFAKFTESPAVVHN